MVLVTINYRLGPFGFLKLDEVTDGKISSTGNEGLMDQRIAIEWVKNNIQDFGGDPDNISIYLASQQEHGVLHCKVLQILRVNCFQR